MTGFRSSIGGGALDRGSEAWRLHDAWMLAQFRKRLRHRLRSVSPLLMDVIALGGLPLPRVLRWLRPAAPKGRGPAALLGHASLAVTMAYYVDPALRGDRLFLSRRRGSGVVVRRPSHPRGRLALFLSDTGLNIEAGLGGAVLVTDGSSARLILDRQLPETVLAALPGRDLGDLLSHPVIDGRRYVVDRLHRSAMGGSDTIVFQTGLVRFRPEFGGEGPVSGDVRHRRG